MTVRSRPPSKEYDENFDRIFHKKAVVAQSIEQRFCKPTVGGLIPSDSTTKEPPTHGIMGRDGT